MNIDQFVSDNKLKRKTVVKWIKNGLIPKADLDRNYVPDSARQPYTKTRAKKADAIYVSMVKASNERKHILPIIYKICEDEFNGYIDRLVQAGLIEKRISDGVTYYDATIQAKDINRGFILDALRAISEGASAGVATVVFKKMEA